MGPTSTFIEQCIVYPGRIVITPDSQSLKNELVVRYNKEKSNDKDGEIPCDLSVPWNEEVKISLKEGQFFEGLKNDFIFTNFFSKSEMVNIISIYETRTGKEIFQTKYLDKKENPFVVSHESGKLNLNYYQYIDLDCSLSAGGQECWKKTLKKWNIADCSINLKNKRNNEIQVFVPVNVKDVHTHQVNYLNGSAICIEKTNI